MEDDKKKKFFIVGENIRGSYRKAFMTQASEQRFFDTIS